MSRARILAVDDQQYFRVFLEDLLREEGYEVTTAASGAEALARLETERFDVVLTDLVMPGMDGSELVQRVKERWPEQDVIVVTSVGDLKTAIDAMKVGASDYLLKPLDRRRLLRALSQRLERRRMREEHGRLVAENLEMLGAFTQYERLLGFFSTLSLETLADRIVEVFCLETNAQGGVLWIARPDAPQRLRLVGVGGLVRVDDEAKELDASALPGDLAPVLDAATQRRARARPTGHARPLSLRALPGRGSAARAAPPRGQARRQRLRCRRSRARRSLRELRRAGDRERAPLPRARRALVPRPGDAGLHPRVLRGRGDQRGAQGQSLRAPHLADPGRARRRGGGARAARRPEYRHWAQEVASCIRQALRNTDLLAVEADDRFCIHLPEADTLGATVAKRRVRAAIERSVPMRALDAAERPTVLCGSATYPGDGSGLDALRGSLDRRIELDRASLLRALSLDRAPFRGLVDALLADGSPGRTETAEQIARFLLEDLARRPHERGVLFVAPGAALTRAVGEGLEALRLGRAGHAPRADRGSRRPRDRAAGDLGPSGARRHRRRVPRLLRRGPALRVAPRERLRAA